MGSIAAGLSSSRSWPGGLASTDGRQPLPAEDRPRAAGFDALVRGGRVLVFGESEMSYLHAPERRSAGRHARDGSIRTTLPAVLITQEPRPPPARRDGRAPARFHSCERPLSTPHAMSPARRVLENLLAPRTTIHGVLMDILGLGVLIGESGIGKSECALDLVVRGHRLVADDTVELAMPRRVVRPRHLPGADAASHGDSRPGPDQHPGSVRRCLDADVQAGRARRPARTLGAGPRDERLGLDDARYDVLGVLIPMIRMPVAPGRNVAIIVEVAARNQLLRAAARTRPAC